MAVILKRFSPSLVDSEDVEGLWLDCTHLLICDRECLRKASQKKLLMLHTSILSWDMGFVQDIQDFFHFITIHASMGEEFLRSISVDRDKLVSITLPSILKNDDMKSAGITLPPDSITIKQVAISLKANIRASIIRVEYAQKVKRTFGKDFKTFVMDKEGLENLYVDYVLLTD